EHIALRAGDAAVAAQFTSSERWPDGSIKQLDVDFNTSLAPSEKKSFVLEYGNDVRPPMPPRGLAVTEEADTIQVGNMQFTKSGTPLLASANYRGELISRDGDVRNGIAVTTGSGM